MKIAKEIVLRSTFMIWDENYPDAMPELEDVCDGPVNEEES